VSAGASAPTTGADGASTAPPAAEACPLCGAPLQPEQEWCLSCGAAARTRLANAPAWGAPIIAMAIVATLSLGVLAAALVTLAGKSSSSTTPTVATVTAAATAAAPAQTATPTAATPTTPAAGATAGTGATSATGATASTGATSSSGVTAPAATTPGAATPGSASAPTARAPAPTTAPGISKRALERLRELEKKLH